MAAALLAKRPHLGHTQLKYVYEVTVHSIEIDAAYRGGALPRGRLSVLWTRGSKTAMTSEMRLPAGARALSFEQPLSLICTLFRDARAGPAPFAEKLCTFAVLEQRSLGMRTIGKCKLDISSFASHDAPSSAPTQLRLKLVKGSHPACTLALSISCAWRKDYAVDVDAQSFSSVGLDDDEADADSLDDWCDRSPT